MDKERMYHDSNNNERTIRQMVECEPEWAANRIQWQQNKIKELKDKYMKGCGRCGHPRPIEEIEAVKKIKELEVDNDI